MAERKVDSRKQVTQDPRLAAAALEALFAAGYVSRRRLYIENFVRGICISAGTLVGAALVATLVLWILSLFDSFPFVKAIMDAIRASSGSS